MENRYSEVLKHVQSLEEDFIKFYEKGNNAAGTRVRGGMQKLKELAQDIRKGVQEMKNEQAEKNAKMKKKK